MIHKLFTFRLLYNLTKKGYNESRNRVCMHKYMILWQEKAASFAKVKQTHSELEVLYHG